MLHIILRFVLLLWFIIKNVYRTENYPLKVQSVGGPARRVSIRLSAPSNAIESEIVYTASPLRESSTVTGGRARGAFPPLTDSGEGNAPPPRDFEAKNVINLKKKRFPINQLYLPLFQVIWIKSSVRQENMFLSTICLFLF